MTDPFARPDQPSGSALEPDGTRAPMERGRYLLPRGKDGKITRHTRATNFAKTIADTYLLSLWQQRMAIKGVTMDPSLYAAVASTAIDNREELNKLAEQAKEVAGSGSRARLGSALHAFTEQVDRGEEPVVPPPWDRDVAAYTKALADLGLEILRHDDLAMIELTVYVEQYDVAGTFDRIARVTKQLTVQVRDPKTGTVELVVLKPGDLVILDLKTGTKLDFGWGEIAVQLALYANAREFFHPDACEMRPMPDVNRKVALVVHLPVGEAQATVYGLNIEVGWTACWLIEQVKTFRKVKDLHCVVTQAAVEPYAEPDTVGRVVEAVHTSSPVLEAITAATSITGLMRIKLRAERAGEWTEALAEVAEHRANELRQAVSA